MGYPVMGAVSYTETIIMRQTHNNDRLSFISISFVSGFAFN